MQKSNSSRTTDFEKLNWPAPVPVPVPTITIRSVYGYGILHPKFTLILSVLRNWKINPYPVPKIWKSARTPSFRFSSSHVIRPIPVPALWYSYGAVTDSVPATRSMLRREIREHIPYGVDLKDFPVSCVLEVVLKLSKSQSEIGLFEFMKMLYLLMWWNGMGYKKRPSISFILRVYRVDG